MAALCEQADPVAKVTILPAGPALGATEQLPEAERHLYTEGYLTDLLTVRLGGRAAELVVFGEGSTGAADDLAGATQIAGRMVRDFGLSPSSDRSATPRPAPCTASATNPPARPCTGPTPSGPNASSTRRPPASSGRPNSAPPPCSGTTARPWSTWPTC
ncbi:hypothetical protein O1L55_05825 [Streptomyces albulus]|nr:hypothetical protein [Streptomyces noursei]